jgi:dsRNA-specific ribonuclease
MSSFREIEKILGHTFKKYVLLEEALQSAIVTCHGSRKNKCNKPLAQVGDSLIWFTTLDGSFHKIKATGM